MMLDLSREPAGEPPAAAVSETALEALRARFRGDLLGPGDPDYDAARRIWNGMIDRRPALIACCTGAADVIAVLRFARERERRSRSGRAQRRRDGAL